MGDEAALVVHRYRQGSCCRRCCWSHLRPGSGGTLAGTVGLQDVVALACGTWSRAPIWHQPNFSKAGERLLKEKELLLEKLLGMGE